jgi:predicted AlkP superfamily phosphohydrolase/phosphomutase
MSPVIIIGIDGCPPALLREWLREGELPTLAGLVSRGSFGVLRSTPNYQSASAWTSIVTGVGPGKHGIFHFTNPVPGSYEVEQINASARRAPTIWRLLSDAGLRVAALNFPVSFPAESVNGAQVAGWLAPTDSSPGFTHPPELADEITRRFGRFPIQPDVRRHALAGRWDEVARVAIVGIRYKAEVARWLAEREAYDLLGVVFVETDSVQHWCWRLIDPTHPQYPGTGSPNPILEVYRALDEELASLLEVAGPDADALVVSDHGQASNSGGQVFLRGWLRAAGYLTPRPEGASGRAGNRLVARAFNLIKNHAPNSVKVRLRARFPGLQSRAQRGMSGLTPDWSRTRAWTEMGHIFINLRGRQPNGIVEPGEEYEALIAELTEGLLALEDEASGERAVAAVTRGDEEFAGPWADAMPDLLVHWRDDVHPAALRWRGADGSEVSVARPPDRTLPSGAHHPDGTFIASGPRIRAGVDLAPLSVCDLAPTVLHLLGRPVPSYMDGSVATEALRPEAASGVRVEETELLAGRAQADRPSDEDQRIIEKRLRGLGYIE